MTGEGGKGGKGGKEFYVCYKNLVTCKKNVCHADKVFVLQSGGLCKQFAPKLATDFDKKTVYGIRDESWMVFIYILFLGKNKKEVENKIKTGSRLSDPRKPDGQPTREDFKKFQLIKEEQTTKEERKQVKERKALSKTAGASGVLSRFDPQTESRSSKRKSILILEDKIVKKARSDNGRAPESPTAVINKENNKPKNNTEKKSDEKQDFPDSPRSEQQVTQQVQTGCGSCIMVKKQLALTTRESNSYQLKCDELGAINRVLMEQNQNLKRDKLGSKLDTIHDVVKAVAGNVEEIKTKLNSQLLGGEISPETTVIDKMTCALDELDEDDSMPIDLPNDKIYCCNGIIVEKKKVKDVGEVKGLQKKLHIIAKLFWSNKVYEWALSDGSTPHHIKDCYITAMKNLINSVKWLFETQHQITDSDVRAKIRRITDQARSKQRQALMKANHHIPHYLRQKKSEKKKPNQTSESEEEEKEEMKENCSKKNRNKLEKKKSLCKQRVPKKFSDKAPIATDGEEDEEEGDKAENTQQQTSGSGTDAEENRNNKESEDEKKQDESGSKKSEDGEERAGSTRPDSADDD